VTQRTKSRASSAEFGMCHSARLANPFFRNAKRHQFKFAKIVEELRILLLWNLRSYRGHRGVFKPFLEPIAQSLTGAHILFGKVTLPDDLPSTLKQLERAQERWLSPILNPSERPPYIGAWNGTAMFMTVLFANPALAATHLSPPPMLPPGGPIYAGLMLLHRAGVLSLPPAGSELDDAAFEPGAIYENNGLFAELCKQRRDWSLIDVHSGVYMLGTRHPHSDKWVTVKRLRNGIAPGSSPASAARRRSSSGVKRSA